MPMEHEPLREPVPVSPRVGQALLLAGAVLTAFSLISNDGEAGALTAIGTGGLGLGLGYLVRRRNRW
jgi:hypothetical protein